MLPTKEEHEFQSMPVYLNNPDYYQPDKSNVLLHHWLSISLDLFNNINNDNSSNIRIAGQTSNYSNTPIVYDSIGLTTRGYDLHRGKGIVIFLHVLGMKGIWRNLNPINVVNNWKIVISSVLLAVYFSFMDI